jgi:HD-GYP domain-containing protein (c-di-GMP phosphodiesterase class II)
MAKTLVERVASPASDVSVFKISGVLGYHENAVLQKFFSECGRKNIHRLILEFSELGSLGGGCARIIREAAHAGTITVCVVGASSTVRNFLESKGSTPIIYVDDLDTGHESVHAAPPSTEPAQDSAGEAGAAVTTNTANAEPPAVSETESGERADADKEVHEGVDADRATDVDDGVDADRATDVDDSVKVDEGIEADKTTPRRRRSDRTDEVSRGPDLGAKSDTSVSEDPDTTAVTPTPPQSAVVEPDDKSTTADTAARELQRKVVQYRALFSVNSEFNRIHEKDRLLDAFLLTAIAQVGVESAAFMELRANAFLCSAWKGFETADADSLRITRDDVDVDMWFSNPVIFPVAAAPLSEEAKENVERWGFPFVAPFIVYEQFKGLVLLGNPIRKALDQDASDYLGLLIKQAGIAYENSCRFEEDGQRMLGLVHSLISMIEENTASRGNTEMIVNYTWAIAKAMHYPEENIQDLLYGTVLRDIGMIKVSDLIVRKPSELQEEEWNIIMGHPSEGAEMLRRMKFSEHTAKVVLCHHERFNGKGYPRRRQGQQIPLGARIVSVVESYCAMLQDRPTRPALPTEEALNTLLENWGIRYDPEVVKVFIEIVEDEIRTGEKVRYTGADIFKA